MTGIENPCPCCSGKAFEDCCQLVIDQGSAKTALALMRSRYTAYHLAHVDYLIQTTSPSRQSTLNRADLKNWADQNDWTKLEIVATENGGIDDTYGIVEFKAYFKDHEGKTKIHHERSNFEKLNGRWYYVDGSFNPRETELIKKVSRNDPCPCGSGKKYKKCCG